MDEPSFDPIDEKPAQSYSKLLSQADFLARMVCKLLMEDKTPDAVRLKTAASVWLENYHGKP